MASEKAVEEINRALGQIKAVGGGLSFQMEAAKMMAEMFKMAVKQLKEEGFQNS